MCGCMEVLGFKSSQETAAETVPSTQMRQVRGSVSDSYASCCSTQLARADGGSRRGLRPAPMCCCLACSRLGYVHSGFGVGATTGRSVRIQRGL